MEREYTRETDPRVEAFYAYPPKWVRDNRTYRNWLHNTGQVEKLKIFKLQTRQKERELNRRFSSENI